MRGWRPGRQPGGSDPPEETPGDTELVVAARFDRHAFAALYRRYEDELLRYCYRCLGDPDEAADATQQVFTNAWSNLERFVDRGGSPQGTFKAWLFTIGHNEVVTRRQRQKRRAEDPLPGEEIEDRAPTPEDLAIAADDHQRLHTLLGQLSPGRRQVIELRLADLKDKEIAGILGMSEGAVRTTQSRAVEQLRDLMGVASPARKGGRDA